jgi:hypothetical protein
MRRPGRPVMSGRGESGIVSETGESRAGWLRRLGKKIVSGDIGSGRHGAGQGRKLRAKEGDPAPGGPHGESGTRRELMGAALQVGQTMALISDQLPPEARGGGGRLFSSADAPYERSPRSARRSWEAAGRSSRVPGSPSPAPRSAGAPGAVASGSWWRSGAVPGVDVRAGEDCATRWRSPGGGRRRPAARRARVLREMRGRSPRARLRARARPCSRSSAAASRAAGPRRARLARAAVQPPRADHALLEGPTLHEYARGSTGVPNSSALQVSERLSAPSWGPYYSGHPRRREPGQLLFMPAAGSA